MHNAIKVLPPATTGPAATQADSVRQHAMPQSMRASRLTALSLMMLVTGVAAQNTLTHGSSVLFQGSTNRGTFATHVECVAAALARSITSQTSYQCRENLTVAPAATPPPPAPPTAALSASPSGVTPGQASTLSWSSTNATGCTAGGSWSGTKLTSGSEPTMALTATSTFSLACTGSGGTANASTTVTVGSAGSMTGLDFPSNSGDWSDIRFLFTGSSLLPMQPATYIWNVRPRQQNGYYTTFFWGFGDGSFTGSEQYYGAHPYPNNPPNGNTHRWEISAIGNDFTADANGNDTTVQYGRWHTQALVVAPSGSNSVLNFYWDLPNTSKRITVTVPGGLRPPSNPVLSFGGAPWKIHDERLSGVLRGLRLYSGSLSIADILSEGDSPLSTSAGSASIWYLNMNPTPSDISDKSGRGHHPTWSSTGRPSLWTQ